MSFNYDLAARQIKSNQIDMLRNYYTSWKGDHTIKLKFRYVKVFGLNLKLNETRWIMLHQFVNKRRITNEKLPELIIKLFANDFIPIRLFQSVSEWLSPNKVNRIIGNYPRMINSGILPLENDDSLYSSIECAKLLDKKLKENRYFVYSGNKSVHVWWIGFNFENYIPEDWKKNIWRGENRENLEQFARKKAFKKIQDEISFELDRRNAIDTRRVVPIIGTVNGFTGRKVMKLEKKQLHSITAFELEELAKIGSW